MKKADIIVILSVILVAITIFLCFAFLGEKGETIVITKDNTVVFEGKLSIAEEIYLGTNTAVIEDGFIYMKNATCKNQICVNHKKISNIGETIVCLPNKIIIEIE